MFHPLVLKIAPSGMINQVRLKILPQSASARIETTDNRCIKKVKLSISIVAPTSPARSKERISSPS